MRAGLGAVSQEVRVAKEAANDVMRFGARRSGDVRRRHRSRARGVACLFAVPVKRALRWKTTPLFHKSWGLGEGDRGPVVGSFRGTFEEAHLVGHHSLPGAKNEVAVTGPLDVGLRKAFHDGAVTLAVFFEEIL